MMDIGVAFCWQITKEMFHCKRYHFFIFIVLIALQKNLWIDSYHAVVNLKMAKAAGIVLSVSLLQAAEAVGRKAYYELDFDNSAEGR